MLKSPCNPLARAACTRFSAAQPKDTNRWWSSGSTAGQRRERSGRIEIAESSLTKDRAIKAPLYAEAGVPEYWIVNLIDDCVEVHSRPQAGRYQDLVIRRRGESIRLVAHADVSCAVDEILPPRTT